MLLIGSGILLGLVAVLAHQWLPDSPRSALFLEMRPALYAVAALALLGGTFALRSTGDSLKLTAVLGLSGYLCAAGLLWGARSVEPVYSGAALAAQLPPQLAGIPMYSVRTYDQTLPFYLRRTMTMVEEEGELTFGLQLEPHKGVPDLAAFEAEWIGLPQALAVLEPRTYKLLVEHDLPMVVRAQDLKRLIVSRR
jgi:hypothetical protein